MFSFQKGESFASERENTRDSSLSGKPEFAGKLYMKHNLVRLEYF
jgi:hypothetical protein